ncbi:hypothetical protein SISNIDRAFT_454123 [Sistotremastrum niveocremeum HHB9708]|uniref:REM-1 domain-containing protein n=1 Tax=Sistotremastrum niveocremeum HHB9708 TaxID=1314777 RepID=A0A164V0R5_9AGAM|nr:hypothetical protein SISNIDRAFT_454123 [Sistotremastrum niveocremeum HHB9708]
MPSTLDMNGNGGINIAIPRRSTEGQGGHSVSTIASNISLIPTDLNELDNDLKGRDLADQLEYLNGLLQKATRIRNGAENLLEASQPRDNLRRQIELELLASHNRITTIKAKMDALREQAGSSRGLRKKTLPLAPPPSASNIIAGSVLTPPNSNSNLKRDRGSQSTSQSEFPDKDDFRTAINHANQCLKTLSVYARHPSATSPLTPPSASSSGSAPNSILSMSNSNGILGSAGLSNGTTAGGVPTSEIDLDKARADVMNRLVGIMQRNLRVRYEVDINDVVRGVTPALADSASRETRACAYRLLRHTLTDVQSVLTLLSSPSSPSQTSPSPSTPNLIPTPVQTLNLEWYILRTLLRPSPSTPTHTQSASHTAGQNSQNQSEKAQLEASTQAERAQSLLLIRSIVEIGSTRHPPSYKGPGSGFCPLPPSIMRALIAIADAPTSVPGGTEDVLRMSCLELLAEILLIDIDLCYRTGAMRVLLNTLVDGPVELGMVIAQAFLVIVDSPRTRVYMRPRIDLEIALSGITDIYKSRKEEPQVNTHERSGTGTKTMTTQGMNISIVSSMLKSWSGLMYLCMDDMSAIRSIIDTLRIPSSQSTNTIQGMAGFGESGAAADGREGVLDMFFGLFNIRPPKWYQEFIAGRRLTIYRRSKHFTEDDSLQSGGSGLGPGSAVPGGSGPGIAGGYGGYDEPRRGVERLNLTDQFISLLLMILNKAGLFDALIGLVEEANAGKALIRKATLLIGEILQIANRVLPPPLAAQIQSLPRLFELAAAFDPWDEEEGMARIVGTSTLSSIDSFNRNRSRLQPQSLSSPSKPTHSHSHPHLAAHSHRHRALSNSTTNEDPMRRQMDQVKLKIGLSIDDKSFQSLLLETQVMLTPDHTKWNFDTLLGLIEGPLLNSKRLEETVRVSKFTRKLMGFFHPFNHRFSEIKNTKANHKWVRLGCILLQTMLASQEGQRYLANEDPLLKQIVACFAQLDPLNGNSEMNPLFSKHRIANTLTCGYLEFLGTLSKYPEGIELMEKSKIFTAFYHVSELKSREDLITAIIQNLDYSTDGHPRIVLSKALTSSYKHIRLYATQHLGQLIHSSAQPNTWTLRLLLTQLYDPDLEVCEEAVRYLEEACESTEVLQLVVDMQPTLDHLGEVADSLLLKFMSTAVGFRYLHGADHIDREMNMWFHERNYHYVVEVEVYLAKTFNSLRGGPDDEDDSPEFEGTVPPHFYGEMTKTELGCQVLAEKGHFAEFAHYIRQHGLESEDTDLILKLKSVLWAVGNIGANEGGLPFLEEEEIIGTILEIAQQSLVLSVRGTCFFVLGLISSTSQGAETLHDFGWEATVSPTGLTTGLCVPMEVEDFVHIPSWSPPPDNPEMYSRLTEPESKLEREVQTAINNLCNAVIQTQASRSLNRIKKNPDTKRVFSRPSMFFRALWSISHGRYRLPAARFLIDLFDVPLDAGVVKEFAEFEKTLVHTIPPPDNTRPSTATPRRMSSPPAARSKSPGLSRLAAPPSFSDSDEEHSYIGTKRNTLNPDGTGISYKPPVLRKIVGFEV